GAVMFSCELDAEIAGKSYSLQLGFAVKKAVAARANLAGANLARADLADANLAGANLAGANLARANLADANLAGANLADADLARAYLAGANLADAYLARAYLAGANLAGARNVPETNGSESAQSPEPEDRAERLRRRAERYRALHPEVPVVPALDAKILSILENGKGGLEMGTWHQCATTHCRGGWATTLAGPAGQELESKHGVQCAATMIYRASTGRVPHFFATNERALEDIREMAALQPETQP